VRRSYCKVENPTAGIEKIRRNNIISLKKRKLKFKRRAAWIHPIKP
jgi:hypothetical protein